MKAFFKKLFTKKNKSKIYTDVNNHTGFYRFSKYVDSNKFIFKINGIPCLPQKGMEEFIFYSETSLIGQGVIPIEFSNL